MKKGLIITGSVCLLGIIAVVGGGIVLTPGDEKPLPVLEPASACISITGADQCITPKPFQPTDFESSIVSKAYDARDPELGLSTDYKSRVLFVDDVPFKKYWQMDNPNTYVFHPMGFGRYIFGNALDSEFQTKVASITQRATFELPNGGRAAYYPNHYPLNRMLGPDLMYSAISQSEMLAGYMKLDRAVDSEQSRKLLDQVLKALFFRHKEGGVNLGVAQLEMPMFRSNPEIILNGWLHALLHLNDYALAYEDAEISEYLVKNLNFFADNHGAWYDEKRNISRYSDTSPHRVVVELEQADQDIALVYRPRDARLSSYFFKPVEDLDNRYSSYDFRVVNRNGKRLTVGLTCSSLFDTYMVSNGPFSLDIRDGGYSPHRATPDASGETHTLTSVAEEGVHQVELALPDGQSELICGYPTNFAKANGKNYYHMQHIVALLYLAKTSSYEDDQLDARLRGIALEWLARSDDFDVGEPLEFEEPHKVLDGLNRGKLLTPIEDVSLLLSE